MEPARISPHERAQRASFWPFVLPGILLYTAVFIAPALYNVGVSFTHWSGLGYEATPAGLANYQRLLVDPLFIRSFWNTIILVALGTVLILAVTVGSMFALRVARGQRVIRAVIFFPQIIAPVAIGTALGFVLDPNGVLNQILRAVGMGGAARAWLAPENVFSSIVVGLVWASSGLFVILMMSAVDNIPEYLYEEARLAGASAFQQFWHVTLPMSRDMFAVVCIMCVIQLMKVFDFVFTLTGAKGGAPTPEARTLAIQQYVTITPQFGLPQLGYGAAMGVVFVVIVGVLMVIMRRISRHETVEAI